MAEKLIDKYKADWDKVCEHYADECEKYCSLYGGSFPRQEFIDWMRPTYRLTKSERGILGDYLLYFHAFLIRKKLDSDKNQHHITLVSGKIGKGKSTLGAQLAALVDPTLNMERICYIPPHFFKRLADCELGEADIIDEGGNFFKSRNSVTGLGKDVAQAFQLVRDLKQFIIICYDEPEKMDKEILSKVDSMLIKIEDTKEEGNRRFEKYLGFDVTATDKARTVMLKERVAHNHPMVLKHKTWYGWNTEEYPQLNDITEEKYRQEKRKFLRDHMDGLAEKYLKDYEHIGSSTDNPERDASLTWIKLSEAKKIIPLDGETFKRRIQANIYRGFKEGNQFFICKEDLEAFVLNKMPKKPQNEVSKAPKDNGKKGQGVDADE